MSDDGSIFMQHIETDFGQHLMLLYGWLQVLTWLLTLCKHNNAQHMDHSDRQMALTINGLDTYQAQTWNQPIDSLLCPLLHTEKQLLHHLLYKLFWLTACSTQGWFLVLKQSVNLPTTDQLTQHAFSEPLPSSHRSNIHQLRLADYDRKLYFIQLLRRLWH